MSEYLRVLDQHFTGKFSSEPYDFGFELDSFQKHAITAIKNNENVLVTAHTGSGKTVPAIFGIADSLEKNKKIIYTSPIKSLSNQKLYELKEKFPDIGILTGDIKFNPDAQCVIMTTEILRNILYQKESQHINISEVDKVIFDEVHYINDPDRGKVWEECIIMMPNDIVLIMLSATIDKAENFASWIGETKQKVTNLIPTSHRVVPLEHFFYQDNELKKIVTHDGKFINYDDIKKNYEQQQCSKMINSFIDFIKVRNLVPALFFIFSRKECERLAGCVQKSLVTSEEISEILNIFNFELRHYKKTYEKSPQFIMIEKLIQKGVAYHHSGLIPILKEVIEILFSKGLIKVLFTTETFAVGVNMPAKTVIFPKLTKYSNRDFRPLRTDEYLQMAGRAGRRGLDKFGTVIILPNDELMDLHPLKKMMTGKSPSINSKFRLSYQFLLKILLNKEINLDGFIGNSLFSQDNSGQIMALENEYQELETKLILNLKQEQKDFIVKYHEELNKAEKLKGNQRKKALGKLNRSKTEIKGFDTINNIYLKYLKQLENKDRLQNQIKYLNTFVMEDSDKMIKYLKDNNYIDPKSGNVLLKGIMACEISECNEIIMTEIIHQKILDDLEPAEIVGTLAAFIEEKNNDITTIGQLTVSPKMKETLERINYISNDFGDYEYNSFIEIGTDWNLYLSFIGPAYDWALGKSIYQIYQNYEEIYEGTFIRNILRIKNIIDNLKNIAEIVSNSILLKKLENLESILIRDQVISESLYILKK